MIFPTGIFSFEPRNLMKPVEVVIASVEYTHARSVLQEAAAITKEVQNIGKNLLFGKIISNFPGMNFCLKGSI